MVVRSVVGGPARRTERGAASRTDAFPIVVHANRDFRDTGNERAAQPHDIRRAGLLLLRRSLPLRRCGGETDRTGQAHDCGGGRKPECRSSLEASVFHQRTCLLSVRGL